LNRAAQNDERDRLAPDAFVKGLALVVSISPAPSPNKTDVKPRSLVERFEAGDDHLHVPPLTIKAVGYLDALFPELRGKSGRNVKAVILALLGYVDVNWRAFPSQLTIAEQSGISRSSVQRSLLTIERLGIATQVRDRDSRGRFDEIELEISEAILRQAHVAGERRREERLAIRNEARSMVTHRHVASVTNHRASNQQPPCFKSEGTVLQGDARSIPSEATQREAAQLPSSQSDDGLFSHLEEGNQPTPITGPTSLRSRRAGRTDAVAILIDRLYDFDRSKSVVRATRQLYHQRERSHVEFRLSKGDTLEQIWAEATCAA
jgi:helix-turn-helix protein